MSTKQLSSFFFTTTDTGVYKCNVCGSERKQAPRTGYTNLISHLATKHPTFQEEFDQFQRQNLTSLEVFGFVDEDTSNMFDWMRWIVKRNLPLCEVENPLTRTLVKMRPTTAESLKASMSRVAKRVGDTIAAEMGDVFGLMFDGWASGTVHFVAILAVYQFGDKRRERLIGLSPMEFGQSANAHIEHISSILNVYNKDMSMVNS